jgi:hypothetical protein
MQGRGPLVALERYNRMLADKMRLSKLSAAADDYQHIVTFHLNLKGDDPLSVMRAVNATARDAGNWVNMTDFEKLWMRDIVSFYSWQRFALPWFVRKFAEHPARFRGMQRSLDVGHQMFGANVPATPYGLPEYATGQGMIAAPESAQPPKQQLGDLNIGHDYAMMRLETPLNLISDVFNTSGIPYEAQTVELFIQMLSGRDRYGREIQGDLVLKLPFDQPLSEWRNWLHSVTEHPVGKVAERALNPVPMSKALVDTLMLYSDEKKLSYNQELRLKYAVGRYWFGLDNAIAQEGRSLGVGAAGLLSAKAYPINPFVQGSYRSAGELRRAELK